MSTASFPEITPAARNRLQQLFENGNKQMSLGGFDYACDMFFECVLGDPGNIIYLQSYVANLRRKFGEKKKKSMFSMLSSGGIKTAEVKKNWMGVIKSGLELLKANPWDASALASMGKACLELGLEESGLAYLKHSIESNPNDAEVNRMAARILREMKKFDDSIACWTRVTKIKPDDREATKAIGDIMVEKTIYRGGYDSAESSREVRASGSSAAVKGKGPLIPEDEDVLGRPLTFEEQIQKRLKKDPHDVSAYVDLAEFYFQADRFKDAEDAYNKALEMDRDNTDLTLQLMDTVRRRIHAELLQLKTEYEKSQSPDIKGKFVAKREQYDKKVLEVAQERVRLAPGNAGNHFELGTIFYQLRRYKEAIGEYQQSKSDATRKGEALLALGQCFQQIKQYKLAQSHYQEAIDNISDQGENKKKALYLATKLAIGLKDFAKADDYANQLAAIDFSYKDIGELLDKIAKEHNNG